MRRSPDLSPARGILIGLVASIPLWALVIAAGVHGYHAMKAIGLGSTENFSSFRTANGGQP